MNLDDNVDEPLIENTKKKRKNKCDIFTKTSSLFYYCTLISSWDDRSWYFLVGIYLVALDPSNLILTAIFGLLSSGLVLLLGSWVGSWVDRSSRLTATYIVLALRNISTLICSVVLCLVFIYHDEVVISGNHPTLLLLSKMCLIIFGISAHLGGMTNNTMLGKDWVAILCEGDSLLLSEMTAKFRLIDMVSKIVAPVIIGQIMTFTSKAVAAIFFSVQVLFSLLLFCFLLKIIYKRIPRLHYREEEVKNTSYESIPCEDEEPISAVFRKVERTLSIKEQLWSLFEGWKVYFSQPIRLAGLGLAALYMTVLGFDTVTIGYALSQGMSEFVLSLFNSGAAITGIIGALMFPCMYKCSNLVYTGIIAILMQLIGLTPSIVSVWIPSASTNITNTSIIKLNTTFSHQYYVSGPLSLYLLMSGIVASRVGLWMFDLTVSQLLIETVHEINRGKVNGVQNSLNMFFDMLKFSMVLGLPYPYQFRILILISVGAVLSASILYSMFAAIHRCTIGSLI